MALIPSQIVAGDSVTWEFSHPTYRASDGWDLSYVLTHANGADTIDGAQVVADGNGWDVTLSAAETGALEPGDWQFTAQVTQGADRHTLESRRIYVFADPTTLAAEDPRSAGERALAAVEATLAGAATQEQRSHQIGGVALELKPHDELLLLRDRLRLEVDREQDHARMRRGERSQLRARIIR